MFHGIEEEMIKVITPTISYYLLSYAYNIYAYYIYFILSYSMFIISILRVYPLQRPLIGFAILEYLGIGQLAKL